MPGPPDRDESDTDAAARHWFALRQGRTISAEERRALADWLAASPDHRAAWARVERDWQSLEHFRGGLSSELIRARRLRPWYYNSSHFKGVLAALMLAALPMLYHGWTGNTQTWHTGVGERRHLVLADGSRLSLDTATRTTITESWFRRLIQLQEGEIYLEAASDRRPLVVMAAGAQIRDVGTRFSVRDTAGKLTVQVAEGAVEITHRDHSLLLRGGEAATGHPGDGEWRLTALQGEIANWRQGVLVFDRHALQDVLQELARYHAVQFDLTPPDLAGKQVSGRFQFDELDTTLRIIADTLNLRVERPAPGRFRLAPASAHSRAPLQSCC